MTSKSNDIKWNSTKPLLVCKTHVSFQTAGLSVLRFGARLVAQKQTFGTTQHSKVPNSCCFIWKDSSGVVVSNIKAQLQSELALLTCYVTNSVQVILPIVVEPLCEIHLTVFIQQNYFLPLRYKHCSLNYGVTTASRFILHKKFYDKC